MRDPIAQARRLLAALGWTYGLPLTHPNSAGWSSTVPLIFTRPLRERTSDNEMLEKVEIIHGVDLDAPDRGRLRVTAPTDTEYFRGMSPIVWADLQISSLDEHLVIDWEGDLPPMPEATLLAELRSNAEKRRELHSLRVALIQSARGHRQVGQIAAAAGVSEQAIYKIYRQPAATTPVPEGDVLAHIRDTIASIRETEIQRPELMAAARAAGVTTATTAHFAGVSDRTVRALLKDASAPTE